MKKVLLLLVSAATLTATQAQVKLGVKGGANLSNVAGRDADGNKATIGFNAGGFVDIPVVNNFSVKPELVYSLQGAKYTDDGGSGKVNMSYLNIPLLAKYSTDFGFFAETGPQLGFLLSAKARQGGEKADVKDAFRKTDFSWAMGVGYLTAANIGVNARYNLGLSKLDTDGDAKVHNSVFQVGVFYVFN